MRKRYLSIPAAAFLILVSNISCHKKMDVPTVAAYSEFATPLLSAPYFVQSDPSTNFKVPLGITNVSNVDRKITIKDSSRTAVSGVQYTLSSNTITIPAGKAVDSLIINGIYSGYPIGRIDTLYLSITGGDVPENAYNTNYSIVLQRYCDVVANDLTGDYANTGDSSGPSASGYNPYTATIANWTSTGPSSATIKIQNLGLTPDIGFGPFDPADPVATGLTAKLDWSDPSNFTVTIPYQPYGNDIYGLGPSTITGAGSFSSCYETFTITWQVYIPSIAYTTNPIITTLKR